MEALWVLRMAHSHCPLDTITQIAGRDAWSILYQHGVVERSPKSVLYGYRCPYRPVPSRWLALFAEHDEDMPEAVREAISRHGR